MAYYPTNFYSSYPQQQFPQYQYQYQQQSNLYTGLQGKVALNQDVLFTDSAVCSNNNSILHRSGSGLVTLRGITNQCRTRFKITFGGNIAVPITETVKPISLAIAINGEPVQSTNMIATPAAVGEFFNVGRSIYVDVPSGCCVQISIKNTTEGAISVQNANLIVERMV